jgi:hypothetical protein
MTAAGGTSPKRTTRAKPTGCWACFTGRSSAGSCISDPSRRRPGIGSPVLSGADLEEIRQGLRDGLRGPILLKWCEQLLAERDELARRLEAARALRSVAAPPTGSTRE